MMSLLAAALLVFSVSTASAGLIDFEESPKLNGAAPPTQGDIISGGYLFDSSANHTHFVNNFSDGVGGTSGSTFLGADDVGGPNVVTMTELTNASFNLLNLDLGQWLVPSSNLLITGFYTAGGTVSTNIALGVFSNYSLNWNALSSVTFDSTAGTGPQYWGVDNILVSSVSVPEPASIFLLLAGLLGLKSRKIKLT